MGYDGSVRDVCDGSLVQLCYGDDGLDVTKARMRSSADSCASSQEQLLLLLLSLLLFQLLLLLLL